jgi:hypothetical protein
VAFCYSHFEKSIAFAHRNEMRMCMGYIAGLMADTNKHDGLKMAATGHDGV